MFRRSLNVCCPIGGKPFGSFQNVQDINRVLQNSVTQPANDRVFESTLQNMNNRESLNNPQLFTLNPSNQNVFNTPLNPQISIQRPFESNLGNLQSSNINQNQFNERRPIIEPNPLGLQSSVIGPNRISQPSSIIQSNGLNSQAPMPFPLNPQFIRRTLMPESFIPKPEPFRPQPFNPQTFVPIGNRYGNDDEEYEFEDDDCNHGDVGEYDHSDTYHQHHQNPHKNHQNHHYLNPTKHPNYLPPHQDSFENQKKKDEDDSKIYFEPFAHNMQHYPNQFGQNPHLHTMVDNRPPRPIHQQKPIVQPYPINQRPPIGQQIPINNQQSLNQRPANAGINQRPPIGQQIPINNQQSLNQRPANAGINQRPPISQQIPINNQQSLNQRPANAGNRPQEKEPTYEDFGGEFVKLPLVLIDKPPSNGQQSSSLPATRPINNQQFIQIPGPNAPTNMMQPIPKPDRPSNDNLDRINENQGLIVNPQDKTQDFDYGDLPNSDKLVLHPTVNNVLLPPFRESEQSINSNGDQNSVNNITQDGNSNTNNENNLLTVQKLIDRIFSTDNRDMSIFASANGKDLFGTNLSNTNSGVRDNISPTEKFNQLSNTTLMVTTVQQLIDELFPFQNANSTNLTSSNSDTDSPRMFESNIKTTKNQQQGFNIPSDNKQTDGVFGGENATIVSIETNPPITNETVNTGTRNNIQNDTAENSDQVVEPHLNQTQLLDLTGKNQSLLSDNNGIQKIKIDIRFGEDNSTEKQVTEPILASNITEQLITNKPVDVQQIPIPTVSQDSYIKPGHRPIYAYTGSYGQSPYYTQTSKYPNNANVFDHFESYRNFFLFARQSWDRVKESLRKHY
ncbi:putative uncharacterized protein DDB_G0282133 [Ctenocephalides felis]|uniref:putative uncharacterized protein DDB_G0282133 n=1 Tax=Ctenocephalides felis TaxID=7515 RepID=UPI000E6E26A1|nr:putative uncharacterized protein DDB_G0282133 [Ctenocephalides felis]